MSIKLIAVDMDGTFLNDTKEYDRERFSELYLKMKEQGIKFVVASGNQYYQLKSFYGDIQDEISYVAENGAFVVDRGEEVSSVSIPKDHVEAVTEEISKNDKLSTIVCGKESAYVLDHVTEEYFKMIQKFYRRLKRVKSFDDIDDQVLKFALSCPKEDTDGLKDFLEDILGEYITPVSSGHGSIDLIVPGHHKANGIRELQKRWHIKDEETMAFGDGGNDIEMLSHVQYGFAMENATEEVKQIAEYSAPSNNMNGVLEIIDQYFKGEGPFK
ncbi:Cof-type HAD-IIB family hydrolase [Salinicoccus sp. HZC-1]|uniref:Cof-type HAD-IIB family hydrolase n=1 Tax=Salinicoccus sp. HZC-1 TaxID=3385497 RepID=UPI00398A5267